MKKWFKAALLIGMAVCMVWCNKKDVLAAEGAAVSGTGTETVAVPEFARFAPRTVFAESEAQIIQAVHQAVAEQAPSVTVVFGDGMVNIPGIFQALLDEQITGYGQGNVAKCSWEGIQGRHHSFEHTVEPIVRDEEVQEDDSKANVSCCNC